MSQVMAPLQVAGVPKNLNLPNWFGYRDVDGEIWRITDFIITDPMAVMKNYTVIAPKIEFKKMFNGTAKQVRILLKVEWLMKDLMVKIFQKLKFTLIHCIEEK